MPVLAYCYSCNPCCWHCCNEIIIKKRKKKKKSRQASPNRRCQHCRPATRLHAMRSQSSRAISALWTSLVAWSSTVLTFWFVEPQRSRPSRNSSDCFCTSYTRRAVERSHVALVSLEFTLKPGQRLMVQLVLMLPLFERSLCHLALVTLCGRSCLASARWAFSVRPFCQTSTVNGRTMNGNARTFVR